MLRITILKSSNDAVTLRLDGEVTGRWTEELQRSCEDALSGGSQLTLDLGGLSFIQNEGLALFRSLRSRCVVLTNASPFVAQQLKDGTS